MNTPRPITRPTDPRRIARRVAVLALAAALAAFAPHAAAASGSKSHSSKSSSTSHASSSHKVDINTATEKELETLPGIGTVMAQKIIAGRPYKSVADLKHAGIPPSTIDGLKGHAMASHVSSEPESPTAHKSSSSHKRSSSGAAAATESPRGAETHGEAAQAHKGSEGHAEAASQQKSGQKTFFGIPIGGSKPAPKSEETPAAPAASAPRAHAGPPPSSASEHAPPAEQPPAKGMVWVNTDSKVYHYEGDRWYGATKHGKFMWEDQAIREGCRASKTSAKP